LSTGLLAWTFLSTAVTKGAAVFGSNAGWIRGTPAPFTVLALRNLYSMWLETVLVGLAVVPMIAINGIPTVPHMVMIVAAIVVYSVFAVAAALLFGCIGAWSSDFQQLVPALMRIAFFATPIFWDYKAGSGRRLMLAQYNPFAHLVEILRAPLMNISPSPTNWIVSLGTTLGLVCVALIVFKQARPRLAAWV
jgi:ABC-type polysaccharide/polyol phosphate export permease